jgi:hypothetical protein
MLNPSISYQITSSIVVQQDVLHVFEYDGLPEITEALKGFVEEEIKALVRDAELALYEETGTHVHLEYVQKGEIQIFGEGRSYGVQVLIYGNERMLDSKTINVLVKETA